MLGRHRPGVTPYNDYLDAEVVVVSGFANGRLAMCLSPEDLDDWSFALVELAAGRGICDVAGLQDSGVNGAGTRRGNGAESPRVSWRGAIRRTVVPRNGSCCAGTLDVAAGQRRSVRLSGL
ncbi:DUF5959 family protein [Streptomyces fildesensis]|uniref:DUF5959 family protein n=1 Tax=Streptomyces fildesensis TaxID=375757 RepID=A0ABW8C5Y0_9ACTN